MMTHDPGRFMELVKVVTMSPELSVADLVRFFKGMSWSQELLWRQFCETNLPAEIPAVAVPVYFVAGRHDYHMNPELTAQYLTQLQSPHKELILFENAGHFSWVEEPERFHAVLLKVRRDTVPAA